MVQARAESAFAGTREVAFQHHLLHQVTYDTVLKSERREAHGRTAAWLAARVGDREAEYLAVTAEHYERAGDQVRALDWYERAAAAAQARFANEAAWTYLQRMLAMPELGDSRSPLEGGPSTGQCRRPDRRPRPPPRRGRRGDPARRGARRRRAARIGGDISGAARRSPGRPGRRGQPRAARRRACRTVRRRRPRCARPRRAVVAGARARRHRAGAPPHGPRPPPRDPGGARDEVGRTTTSTRSRCVSSPRSCIRPSSTSTATCSWARRRARSPNSGASAACSAPATRRSPSGPWPSSTPSGRRSTSTTWRQSPRTSARRCCSRTCLSCGRAWRCLSATTRGQWR